MKNKSVFEQAIERVEAAYSEYGFKLGWRFLYSPANTLSASTRLMFVGLNPGVGGASDQGIASVETGSAYRVESNWSSDGKRLQKEVVQLFEAISAKLKVDRNHLMDGTLTANFCPFKSETFSKLPNRREAIKFSHKLWRDVFFNLRPTVIICMGRRPFNHFHRILIEQGFQVKTADRKPTGWGSVTYMIEELVLDCRELMMVQIPHLSRFKIVSSKKCSRKIDGLVSSIVARLNKE